MRWKQVTALVLSAMMLYQSLPVSVIAAEKGATDEIIQESEAVTQEQNESEEPEQEETLTQAEEEEPGTEETQTRTETEEA